jgi:Bifunctional DNA primase/polymerase, N-terminal/Primase C terminal 2 (PriCT-2)
MTSLKAALSLQLPCFPCRNAPDNPRLDKTPATKHGFHDASTDPGKIRAMFNGRPNCLIGVPTGTLAEFDVLDIDPRSGGNEWYQASKHKLPETRVHHTRHGGWHLLFKHLPGLQCDAGHKIAAGVDIRADGGYVIWWPAHGHSFTEYPPSGIPNWPQFLAELLQPKAADPGAIENESFPHTPENEERVLSALSHVGADDRDIWLHVGMALHATGWATARAIWDKWSTISNKFDPRDQAKTWAAFHAGRTPRITVVTIFNLARDNGWRDPANEPLPLFLRRSRRSLIQQTPLLRPGRGGRPLARAGVPALSAAVAPILRGTFTQSSFRPAAARGVTLAACPPAWFCRSRPAHIWRAVPKPCRRERRTYWPNPSN